MATITDPKLVEALLGKIIADMMDGTIEFKKCNENKFFGSLKVGDELTFKFKTDTPFVPRQFIVTESK